MIDTPSLDRGDPVPKPFTLGFGCNRGTAGCCDQNRCNTLGYCTAPAQPWGRKKEEPAPTLAPDQAAEEPTEVSAGRLPPVPASTRLNEIATLVSSLTYGEMIELAAALWSLKPEGKELAEIDLPVMLHKWSEGLK